MASAQLLDALFELPGQRGHRVYNDDNPRVIYYVVSRQLDTWATACAYWGTVAARLAGADYDSAVEQWRRQAIEQADTLAESSSGVHLSYAGSTRREGRKPVPWDRVNVEAIHGAIDGEFECEWGSLPDGTNALLRFAIGATAYAEAINRVSEVGRAARIDSEESSDESDGRPTDGPEARPKVRLLSGRSVIAHNYKSM